MEEIFRIHCKQKKKKYRTIFVVCNLSVRNGRDKSVYIKEHGRIQEKLKILVIFRHIIYTSF